MQHGFKAITPQLIRETPGLSATDYARIALERGLCGSDSKDPEGSLATTLAKEYREGRMPGIRAERVNGKLRYFTADNFVPYTTETKRDPRIEVALPPRIAKWIDVLLATEKFAGPGEAIIWLADEGIKSRRDSLAALENAMGEIKRMRQSAQELL